MKDRAIFTDLDGTFLDFETYQPGPALALAKQLIAEGDLLVFCSSKTRAEQVALMQEFKLSLPAIVENGSGLYLPPKCSLFEGEGMFFNDGSHLISWGMSREKILGILNGAEKDLNLKLKGYQSLSVEEVASLTGLSRSSACLARARDFSETLTASLPVKDWQKLNDYLKPHCLKAHCGGRFYTVSNAMANKGAALKLVFTEIVAKFQGQWASVALGDSANDFSLLDAADEAFLLKNHTDSWASTHKNSWNRIPSAGPEGWCQVFEK